MNDSSDLSSLAASIAIASSGAKFMETTGAFTYILYIVVALTTITFFGYRVYLKGKDISPTLKPDEK